MPESSAWSDPVTVREMPAGLPGVRVRRPLDVDARSRPVDVQHGRPISRDAHTGGEIARDLTVTFPSGKPVRWYTPSDPVSEVASGSLPSAVTE